MRVYEFITKPKGPLTPEQARIEALKAQVKRSQEAVKAERAKQKVKAGQRALASANSVANEADRCAGFVAVNESQRLQTFQVQVRVAIDNQSTLVATELKALNIAQARAILRRLYGSNNIVSITT